jgi:hypothetical protein
MKCPNDLVKDSIYGGWATLDSGCHFRLHYSRKIDSTAFGLSMHVSKNVGVGHIPGGCCYLENGTIQ